MKDLTGFVTREIFASFAAVVKRQDGSEVQLCPKEVSQGVYEANGDGVSVRVTARLTGETVVQSLAATTEMMMSGVGVCFFVCGIMFSFKLRFL